MLKCILVRTRKHPAPGGLFRGLVAPQLSAGPENGQSDRQPLEQALRVNADRSLPVMDAALFDGNQDLHPRWIRAR